MSSPPTANYYPPRAGAGQLSGDSRTAAPNPLVAVPKVLYIIFRLAVGALIVGMLITAVLAPTAPNVLGRVFAAAILTFVASAPLLFSFKGVGLFHPLYLLSALNFVKNALPNFRTWAIGIESHSALPGMNPNDLSMLQIEVLLLSALAWGCTFVGFFASSGIKWKSLEIRENNRLLAFGAIASLLIGMASLMLLMQLSGGFFEHLKNITRGHAAKVWVGNAEYASIYATLVPLTLLAPCFWILLGKRALASPLFWALVVNAAVCAFLVNGRRSAFVMAIAVMVACWILSREKVPLGRVFIVMAFLFLSIGVLGEYRRSNWGANNEVSFEAFQDFELESGLLQSIQELEGRKQGGAVFPIVALVPERVSFLYGRNYLQYVNRFIPRVIWPGKPRGIGLECAAIFYGRENVGGIPPGALGEAYWSGGLIGVSIVFMVWGFVLKSAMNFFVKFRYSVVACFLYLLTISKLGPSEPQFRAWLYIAAPATVMLFSVGIMKFRVRSR